MMDRKRTVPASDAGFTVLELLLALAITIGAAALVLPRIGAGPDRYTVRSAALSILAALQTARSEAIAGSRAGDLLLLAWSWRNPSYDHVEMMTGGPRCIGHGGPGMGPVYKDAATQMRGAVMWEIRRYV